MNAKAVTAQIINDFAELWLANYSHRRKFRDS
jgi:hypothetical protein